MTGWYHRLDGHEFGWTPGVGDGQGGLACCNSWGRKELDMTERLNWTELSSHKLVDNPKGIQGWWPRTWRERDTLWRIKGQQRPGWVRYPNSCPTGHRFLKKWDSEKVWDICLHVSDAGRDWGQEEKGMTEDEMARWHHWLDGRASEWTPGVGDGQGGLTCCDSWGHKESDTTEQLNWLNWTELIHPRGKRKSVMCPVGANLVLASEQSPGPAQITGCLASVVSEDLRT